MLTTLKRSKQRDAIVEFLKSRKDHPTADTVYYNVKEQYPNISLGTVYRNLALLSDRGEILKLSCDGKADRFDATTAPHYHFICRECGDVIDLDMESIDMINQVAAQNFGGVIEGHVTYFYGTCHKCMQKETVS